MFAFTPPGSTIGLLGGGQLGRMFGIAARRMGYRVHTYEPAPDSPAGQVSDREFNGSYQDAALLAAFTDSVDVITFEFENIPADVVEALAVQRPVFPCADVLHICQNRLREKRFLHRQGYPYAPFALVETGAELTAALRTLGLPAVLKTADFGYDGKGQVKISAENQAAVAAGFSGPAVLESWVDFERELSVICARDQRGEAAVFPAIENHHARHILDHSIAPGRFPPEVVAAATGMAESLTHDLGVVGLLAVEFFVCANGRLLVNELAPRPHNSGHFTFDACVTSQFEQQLRAVCGLPFGSPALLCPAVMVNLLGDLWKNGTVPDWTPVLRHPRTKLHLYGKVEGRPGRKMGHYCVLDETVDRAVNTALRLKHELLHANPHPLALFLSCSLFVAGQVACQERPAAPNAFGLQTRDLRLGPAKLTVEVASTPEQSATGLMFRDVLPPDRGMLFVFEAPRQANFWMKNTRIPLSIGFIDASGSLLEVRSMHPYDESLVRSVSDRVAYALEVNEGWFSEHQIKPGTKIQGLTRR